MEGREFIGWYINEKKYNGGETVTDDLTITAVFTDMYSVNFVVLNDDGTVSERLSQYYRTKGEAIGTMPEDPFVSGKVFEKWVIEGTDTEVTAETVVSGNMTVVAQFREVSVYDITAEYYYLNDSGNEVVFNTDIIEIEEHELPCTITAPASTQTAENEVAGSPTYYVKTPTVEVTQANFDNENKYTVRFQYVEYTAEYDFVYMLKDLTGDDYTKIDGETTHEYGVLNSTVTATVKNFDYASFERAPEVEITEAEGQEVPVYYTRKNFSVSYETNGGSYVAGETVPYGTAYSVTTETPTRNGYTFAGWYTDEDLTQAAGSTVTVNGNTTLYAKWEGETVNYTIVYMLEKYNDAGTESSYVYDNSAEGTAQVGTTVQASDAPAYSKTGWEKDTEKNAESSVTIAADGSSVLFVYYKLTEYTFYFRPGTYNRNNVTATLEGDEKTGNNNFAYTMKLSLGRISPRPGRPA